MDTNYVLVTPAKNEEEYIGHTIQSVIKQTIKPIKWVIVSDGSTDKTDSIVNKYLKDYEFIELITAESQGKRNFGSKVYAFNEGYKRVQNLNYSYIGNLDADVSFQRNYFEEILKIHRENPKLGLAGGIIQELINGVYVTQTINKNSVAGAIQLFKKQCFDDIGGYKPISVGGIDALAEIMAKFKGWNVRNYEQFKVLHHRRVAIRNDAILNARMRQGRMFYKLGYHPLFHLLRCASRFKENPFMIGSIFLIIGFFKASIKNEEYALDENVRKFLHKEQMNYLKNMILFKGN